MLSFMTLSVALSVRAQVSTAEFDALVALYATTDGDHWTNASNWDINNNTVSDDWHGVTVEGGHVVQLNLIANNLNGTIPSAIGDLTSLEGLYLGDNNLTGEIPDAIGDLTLLESLNLSKNSLSGDLPATVSELAALVALDVSDNALTGPLPAGVFGLTHLTTLDVSNNKLDGSLPAELGNLKALQDLMLSNNGFSGAIPEEIGNLTALEDLRLESNAFSGTIPSSIGELTALEMLYLGDNALTGILPAELSELANLQRLDLNNNQLSGELNADISQLQNLTVINLDGNQFEGNLPPELFELPMITSIEVRENRFSGDVSSSLSTSAVTTLDLNDNDFSALPRLPDGPFSFLDVSNNRLSFEDIERNLDLFTSSGQYQPQKRFAAYEFDVEVSIGEPLTLTVSIGGANNLYKWTKIVNGAVVFESPVSSSPQLSFSAVAASDSGTYYCTVTNSVVADLAISSESFKVIAKDTRAAAFQDDYPDVDNITDISARVVSRIDEPGECHFTVQEATADTPSPAQIIAGKDAAGNDLPENQRGTIVLSDAGAEGTATITGLMPETEYKLFAVTVDTAGNVSPSVRAIAFSTTKTVVSAEEELRTSLLVYPNPVRNALTVIPADGRAISWRIIDQLGKEIHPDYSSPYPGSYLIDFRKVKSASYILEVRGSNEVERIRVIRK